MASLLSSRSIPLPARAIVRAAGRVLVRKVARGADLEQLAGRPPREGPPQQRGWRSYRRRRSFGAKDPEPQAHRRALAAERALRAAGMSRRPDGRDRARDYDDRGRDRGRGSSNDSRRDERGHRERDDRDRGRSRGSDGKRERDGRDRERERGKDAPRDAKRPRREEAGASAPEAAPSAAPAAAEDSPEAAKLAGFLSQPGLVFPIRPGRTGSKIELDPAQFT